LGGDPIAWRIRISTRTGRILRVSFLRALALLCGNRITRWRQELSFGPYVDIENGKKVVKELVFGDGVPKASS